MEGRKKAWQDEPQPEGLLSVRALGIMLAGVVTGLVVGVLCYWSGQPVPAAVVEGLAATGTTIYGLHRVVERSQQRRRRSHHAACEHTTVPAPRSETSASDVAQLIEETTAELGQRIDEAVADEPDTIS